MLTDAAAQAASPRERAYKLRAGGGLHLHVSPTGAKSWRLKCRFAGREKLLTLGRFPAIGVAAAEERRDSCKFAIAEGRDPSAESGSIDSFEQLARAWLGHNREGWSAKHADDVEGSLARDVFPAIGAKPIKMIAAPTLLQLLGKVEKRGCVETARRLRQRLSEIFAFGIALDLVASDPAARLGVAMKSVPPSIPQPALTSIDDCRALLAACELADARPVTRLASRFLALTAVRLDAVRGMRWSEVSYLGGDAPLWIVPAARMKLAKGKKREARFDFAVPLSPAAVEVLRAAANMHSSSADLPVADNKLIGGEPLENGYYTHSGGQFALSAKISGALVFPGRGNNQIGEGTIGELYDRAGYAGRHVPHGWRASFSTLLNRDLGEESRWVIDCALAHSPKDKVEAAYNRDIEAELVRRRAVLDRWAELLGG